MRKIIRQPRLLLLFLIAFVPGCLSCLNHLPEPPCELRHEMEQIHHDSRNGVYIFFVNGTDALCCANLKGVREYLARIGFERVYIGQLCHEAWIVEEIRTLHRDQPGSRFVVVGFEFGAPIARRIVQSAAEEGAPIDLLLYLEPKGLLNYLPNCDEGVRRVISVEQHSWFSKSDIEVDDVEIVHVSCRTRYGVPTHPVVLDLLAEELAEIAQTVPVYEWRHGNPPSLLDETAPPPRPMPERKPDPEDEWDFLKLANRPRALK